MPPMTRSSPTETRAEALAQLRTKSDVPSDAETEWLADVMKLPSCGASECLIRGYTRLSRGVEGQP